MKKKIKEIRRDIMFYFDTHSKEEFFYPKIKLVLSIILFLMITMFGCVILGFKEITSILLGFLIGGMILALIQGIDLVLRFGITKIKNTIKREEN